MSKIIFTRKQILRNGRLRRLLPVPPKDGILIVEQNKKPWSAKIRIYDKYGNLQSTHGEEYLYLELMLALKRKREYKEIGAKLMKFKNQKSSFNYF